LYQPFSVACARYAPSSRAAARGSQRRGHAARHPVFDAQIADSSAKNGQESLRGPRSHRAEAGTRSRVASLGYASSMRRLDRVGSRFLAHDGFGDGRRGREDLNLHTLTGTCTASVRVPSVNFKFFTPTSSDTYLKLLRLPAVQRASSGQILNILCTFCVLAAELPRRKCFRMNET
jgi:hypothetical protein